MFCLEVSSTMMRIQNKLSFALLFSTAIHLAVFSVLYTHFSQINTQKDSNLYNSKRATHKDREEHLLKELAGTDASIETNTNVIASKVTLEGEQKLFLQAEQNNDLRALEAIEEKETLREAPSKTDKNSVNMVVPEQNLEHPLQKRSTLNYDEDALSITNIKDTGLLNNDTPNTVRKTKIDESEKLLKAHVEDVNTQLSAAINEIKERNQKKINQQRQQQAYTYVSED